MSYILRVGSKLYFRRGVPLEFQASLGMVETRQSLRTRSMDDAKAIAAHLNQMVEKASVAVASGLFVTAHVILPSWAHEKPPHP